MAEKSTFIKIDRNILNWGWYKDQNTKAVFLHLLLTANIREGEFLGVKIHRGEVATSYGHLAKDLDLSIKCVRTAIRHLCWTGEVACRSYAKFTVFSIVSYDKYQAVGHGIWHDKGQATGTQWAREGQQSKNIRSKEGKKDSAPRQWEIDRKVPDIFAGRFETEAAYLEYMGVDDE